MRDEYADVLAGAGTGIVKVPPLGSDDEPDSIIGARPCKVCGRATLDSTGVCDICRRRGDELREQLFRRCR